MLVTLVQLGETGFALHTVHEGTWYFKYSGVLQWKFDEGRSKILLRTRLEPKDPYIVQAASQKPEKTKVLYEALKEAMLRFVGRVEKEVLLMEEEEEEEWEGEE